MLIHAVPLAPPAGDGLSISQSDIQSSKQIFARARGMLLANLEVHEIVRPRSAADEILLTNRDWRADLIVMGTHGRGRIVRFLLGSVAEAVIRRAACPVVTVAHEPGQDMWHMNESTADHVDVPPVCVQLMRTCTMAGSTGFKR